MKKIFIALALVLAVQAADAQTKSPAAAKKGVESALAAVQKAEAAFQANPKKVVKPTVYLGQAKAYMDAYNSPAGNVWVGMSKQDMALLVTEKPLSTEMVVLGGEQMEKQVFENKNIYFNAAGVLSIVEVTKPAVENALAGALEGYVKAHAADPKGSKTKDITTGIENIHNKYMDEAIAQYTFGNLALSSDYFGMAAKAYASAPLNKFDSVAVYNCGFTALGSGKDQVAKECFQKCYENGYYYEGGDVFAKLYGLYMKDGDTTKAVSILKEGFQKNPESQVILVSLINYYIESGDNQDELFALIDVAKKNEPNNPSLYYVEGNIHAQLGHEEEAIAAYYKSNEVDPSYEYGLIGAGVLYYNKAVAIAEEASNEFNDAKYMKLVAEFEENFLKAVEPFEKAYELTTNQEAKINLIAESLKNIYYRFQDRSDEYKAGYEKYSAIVKASR